MNHRYKIAVLGPIARDHVTTHQGEVFEKYGCVIYTAAVLSALCEPGSAIVPVTHVRRTDLEPVLNLLSTLPGVDLEHVSAGADRGDIISLRYLDQNRRVERQTGLMPPIAPHDVDPLLDADAFVMVPITDFEVPLNTLAYIKAHSDALVVFDAHGPTNGCSRAGERFHKFWVDRDMWLPHIDILKMNLEEAACSWFPSEIAEQDLDQRHELALDELPKFAHHCLAHGVRALYVTLDEYGCAVYFHNRDGDMKEHFVKRIHVDKVVDTTGCGDSFAGGLTFGYLRTKDFIRACYFGNAAGAQRCSGSELAVYRDLAATELQIQETYLS